MTRAEPCTKVREYWEQEILSGAREGSHALESCLLELASPLANSSYENGVLGQWEGRDRSENLWPREFGCGMEGNVCVSKYMAEKEGFEAAYSTLTSNDTVSSRCLALSAHSPTDCEPSVSLEHWPGKRRLTAVFGPPRQLPHCSGPRCHLCATPLLKCYPSQAQ